MAEYYSAKGDWPTDNAGAGLASDTDIKGNNVTSVTVGGQWRDHDPLHRA